jgi:predicted nucleotidyltransferase
MLPTLILYGSKARGDARPDSDVDLIYALEGEDIQAATYASGVSIHRYPKLWLEKQAQRGALFAYHVAFEGVALEDPSGFLDRMRRAYKRKASYEEEIVVGTLVMKLLLAADWEANFEARRRFFWALRTVLIAAAADDGGPIFSPILLEARSRVRGVADLIDQREEADFATCRVIGEEVLARYLRPGLLGLAGEALRRNLMERGGIARDSVRVVEEGEAIAEAGLAIYG